MKVFLDTNVLASAAATRGLCADLFRAVLASHELLISKDVLNELKGVLRSKFGLGHDLVGDFAGLLQQDAVVCQSAQLPRVEVQDKDDLPILGAASAGKAEFLVTGDKELLELGRIGETQIVSPRQFWEKLKAQQQRRTGRGKRRRSR